MAGLLSLQKIWARAAIGLDDALGEQVLDGLAKNRLVGSE